MIGLGHDPFEAQVLDDAQRVEVVNQLEQRKAPEHFPRSDDPALVELASDLGAAPTGDHDLSRYISEGLRPLSESHMAPPSLGQSAIHDLSHARQPYAEASTSSAKAAASGKSKVWPKSEAFTNASAPSRSLASERIRLIAS